MNISSSSFTENYAGSHGGGVMSSYQNKLFFKQCAIVRNTCALNGGGLGLVASDVSFLTNTTIGGNVAAAGTADGSI